MPKQYKMWQQLSHYPTDSDWNKMPDWSTIEETDFGTWVIIPNLEAVQDDIYQGFIQYAERVTDNYRGYVLDVNDHGNTILLYRYKNGNTKEIWSMV